MTVKKATEAGVELQQTANQLLWMMGVEGEVITRIPPKLDDFDLYIRLMISGMCGDIRVGTRFTYYDMEGKIDIDYSKAKQELGFSILSQLRDDYKYTRLATRLYRSKIHKQSRIKIAWEMIKLIFKKEKNA